MKSWSVGERDKMMNDIATVAATEYCRHYEATGGANQERIKQNRCQNAQAQSERYRMRQKAAMR
jgi:hypothetical protein